MSRSKLTHLALQLLVLVTVGATPSLLHAQTTTPKVFHACYVPNSGTVYRIQEVDVKQECSKTTHVPFSWTDGSAPGFSQVAVVNGNPVDVPAGGGFGVSSATCPVGTTLISGGHILKAQSAGAEPVVFLSGPSAPIPNQWQVGIDNSQATTGDISFVARALCAK